MKIPFLKPSTRAWQAEVKKTAAYSRFDWLHGQIYGRLPYLYIGIGTGQHRIGRLVSAIIGKLNSGKPAPTPANRMTAYQHREKPGFADEYHGKVMPLEQVKALVSVREPISLPLPEVVLPYARARDLILQQADHIVALDCPCRAARENPCLPLDVCLIVGEPFASFILEHQPGRSRAISSSEAIQILQAEDERGHVHHAFFKQAMLGRFYAICNCCSCCCGAINAHKNGTPMLAASGYLAVVDEDRCAGCGVCIDYCQFGALSLDDVSRVDIRQCMGCGICVGQCSQEAIQLVRSGDDMEPLILPPEMANHFN